MTETRQQRKPKAKRAFQGMAGSPTAIVDETVTPQTAGAPIVPVEVFGINYDDLAREQRQKILEENQALNEFRNPWTSVLQSAGVSPSTKCVHGHMYYEHYCDVCRLAPIDPDYNPDTYRVEIDKALGQSRRRLYGEEGAKDFKDIKQIVDIEIWKTSKSYGKKMNARLAYTVASNQAGKYLTARIEQPKFVSMDDRPEFEDGSEGTSAAELAVIAGPKQGTEGGYSTHEIGSLLALVASWHGAKRLVGEAMLRPDFSVRNVPGVPHSTVGRVRQVILREFKSHISKGL